MRATRQTAGTEVGELIARADSLGLFPALAARIRAVADDAASSLVALEEVVCLDTTLSAALLRLANSAFYGMRRQVGTVRQAILVLGFRATRDLALGLALASIGRSSAPLRQAIWDQAVRGAAVARAIASHLRGRERQGLVGEAFLAGLLRDLGRVLLLELEGPRYRRLCEEDPARTGEQLIDAERAELGFDHATLGGACLDSWRLPEATCAAVAQHHTSPDAAGLEALIWLADRIESLDRAGADESAILEATAPGVTALGLDDVWLPRARAALEEAWAIARGLD